MKGSIAKMILSYVRRCLSEQGWRGQALGTIARYRKDGPYKGKLVGDTSRPRIYPALSPA